jgi:glutathione synthase/RimK-type ligase-like ATP-grasp enzyme
MRLWILTNPPPVSGDTAYMIGRVLSHCAQVHVTPISETEAHAPVPPGPVDGILNRSFCINPDFLAEMDALAADLGVRLINAGAPTMLACDKRTYPEMYPGMVPETWVLHSVDELAQLHTSRGETLVMKGPFGKRGEQVMRFRGPEDHARAQALLDMGKGSGLVVQRFCEGFREGDKRVILHRLPDGGFEIAAWYARIPAEGGWKSNVSAGGRVEQCDLAPDEEALSLAVAKLAGLDYIGIDIGRDALRDGGRCLLIETNGYTGGHIDFDVAIPGKRSGDNFARMVAWLCRENPKF